MTERADSVQCYLIKVLSPGIDNHPKYLKGFTVCVEEVTLTPIIPKMEEKQSVVINYVAL